MLRAFAAGKETFQHIRPVPLLAGACTLHTHRVIHWGSAPKPRSRLAGRTPRARVALSCAFSTPDFEPPYIKARHAGGQKAAPDRHLSFPMRLALSGAQVVNYGDRWIGHVPPHIFRTCHELFREQERHFVKTYRAEVDRKFAHLSAEISRRGSKTGGGLRQGVSAGCDDTSSTSSDDDCQGSEVAAEVQAAAQEEEDRWLHELVHTDKRGNGGRGREGSVGALGRRRGLVPTVTG